MRKKVLVIEDEQDIVELFRRRLTLDGYDVLGVFKGTDALIKVKEFRPDIITLDLHLPDISGTEVLKKLKRDEDTKDIPVIVITGADSANEIIKHFDMGVMNYLTKPVSTTELIQQIEAALSA